MKRASRLPATAAAVALVCGVLGAGRAHARQAPPAAGSTEASVAPGLRVEVRCSETGRRAPFAIVSWRRIAGGLEGPEDAARIDVAANKRGFAKGDYARLSTGPQGGVEGPAPAPGRPGTLNRTLDLRIDDAGLEAVPGAQPSDVESVTIRNLEPGVVYFWRIARRGATSQTVRVKAPACVTDQTRERQ